MDIEQNPHSCQGAGRHGQFSLYHTKQFTGLFSFFTEMSSLTSNDQLSFPDILMHGQGTHAFPSYAWPMSLYNEHSDLHMSVWRVWLAVLSPGAHATLLGDCN